MDWDGKISSVFFLPSCNFRCPFCHNVALVLHPETEETTPFERVEDYLKKQKTWIDGICITGGEPTLQPDLLPFLRQVQALGLDAKVDTNGYHPDVLEMLLDAGLLDFVALDIKAPPEKYPLLSGLPDVDVAHIEQSIALLKESAIPYEFRTTVVPGLLDANDVEAIARWIVGAQRYALQQFRPTNTIDPALEAATPYPMAKLQAMAERARAWVPHTVVRRG